MQPAMSYIPFSSSFKKKKILNLLPMELVLLAPYTHILHLTRVRPVCWLQIPYAFSFENSRK